MTGFFAGKVVIVTGIGSSNGIGRGTALMLAAQGAKLTITGTKSDALAVTKKECLAAGATENNIHEVLGDIALEETCKKIVEETVAKFGESDVLINNAGALIPDKQGRLGIEQPIELFDRNMAVNVRSVIIISNLAVPHLEKTKGDIVNVSSIGAFPFIIEWAQFYCAAKAALDQITVQMAGTLIHKGIRVNAVNPGMVVTNCANNAGIDGTELILFLADRSQSEFIIGQRYTADGGMVLKLAFENK